MLLPLKSILDRAKDKDAEAKAGARLGQVLDQKGRARVSERTLLPLSVRHKESILMGQLALPEARRQ